MQLQYQFDIQINNQKHQEIHFFDRIHWKVFQIEQKSPF